MKSFILILLISCSFGGSLLIGQLDSYLSMKTADRLHLYTKQEDALEQDIQKILNRSQAQIKNILAVLVSIRERENKQIKNAELNLIKKNFKIIFTSMTDLIGKYSAQLSKLQMEKFLKDLNKRNQKTEKKLNEKRYKKRIPNKFKEIFGSITNQQEQLLQQNISPFLAWNIQRHKVNSKLYSSLQKTNGPSAEIIQIYKKVQAGLNVNFEQGNLDNIIHIINEFTQTLTKEQVKTINEKLDLVIDIMKSYLTKKY